MERAWKGQEDSGLKAFGLFIPQKTSSKASNLASHLAPFPWDDIPKGKLVAYYSDASSQIFSWSKNVGRCLRIQKSFHQARCLMSLTIFLEAGLALVAHWTLDPTTGVGM